MLAACAAAGDSARIVSCYARTEETRDTFADKHGCRAIESLEEIWSDSEVEGVLIATPHSVRAELIERAAAAGKHIFVEKPLALTGAEARSSAAAAESAGLILQVGHNKRRQTGNRRLHEMLDSGELGALQYIEANISVPVAFKTDLPEWRNNPELVSDPRPVPRQPYRWSMFWARSSKVPRRDARWTGPRLEPCVPPHLNH